MKKLLVTAPTVVAGLVLIAAAWLLFAPAELGGATRYAVVEGASMEPGLSRGDLVLVRGGGEPDVGDAVLYRDPTLRRPRAPPRDREGGRQARPAG